MRATSVWSSSCASEDAGEDSGAPFEFAYERSSIRFDAERWAGSTFHGTREQALEAVGLSEQDAHADS